MSTPQSVPHPLARLAGALLANPWLRPLNDPDAIDDLLGLVEPTWSLTAIRARVVAAVRETPDARTLLLAPNRLWPGHRAGQHVTVQVEIGGRRLTRPFSLSSPPRADGLVAITVKRQEGGTVSRWWNEDARVGDVVTLGSPAGDFALPNPLPPRLTMVSAGSGITPLMAMLRSLEATCNVRFVHAARSRRDTIFLGELEEIAGRRSGFTLDLHLSNEGRRLDAAAMLRLAEECGDAPALVCGPQAFMDAFADAWREAGATGPLQFEHFGLATRRRPGGSNDSTSSSADTTVTARASLSGTTFSVAPGQTLLDAAEAAGLRPLHGCRIGVCHTCRCVKVDGAATDLRDGRVFAEPGETIQLCVATATSDLTLEL